MRISCLTNTTHTLASLKVPSFLISDCCLWRWTSSLLCSQPQPALCYFFPGEVKVSFFFSKFYTVDQCQCQTGQWPAAQWLSVTARSGKQHYLHRIHGILRHRSHSRPSMHASAHTHTHTSPGSFAYIWCSSWPLQKERWRRDRTRGDTGGKRGERG